MVSADDEILVFSSAGNIIRMEAGEISSQGRDATGVRIARVGAGETVSAVAPVLETVLETALDAAAEGEAGMAPEPNGEAPA
jgi:DNA gyrase subunit A